MANILKSLNTRKQKKEVWKLYDTSDRCPLENFRLIVNTGNIKNLIIQGNPPENEIEEAWNNIYSEFSEITRDKSADLAFLDIKQTATKRHKIAYQSVLLQIYAMNPSEEFRELLETEGFKVTPDADTTYRMAFGKLKRMQNDLDFREKQKEPTQKTDFDLVIADVERFQGYGFNQKEMTVRHFANIYKRFKDHERENRA